MFQEGIFNILRNQKGQALLIIVLVMVVALTVGLSLASRTIINIRNTREQASSQKALSAAEAGIEQAIKSGANVAGSFSGNTSYSTTVTQVAGNTQAFVLNGGKAVSKNDATYIWVTDPTDQANLWQNPWSGNLSIYWGTSGQNCDVANNMPSAIEVSVISGSKDAPVMTRYVYDPCGPSSINNRRSSNNFSPPTSSTQITPSGTGITFSYTATRALTNALLVRVNPIYASSIIGAYGGGAVLPQQGKVITSTGTSDDNTQRKVTVFQGYPEVPAEFFPYILFQP